MAEAEAVLADEGAPVRAHEALADERLQVTGDLGRPVGRSQVGDRAPPEDLAHHRSELQDRELFLREPVEPGTAARPAPLPARATTRPRHATRAGRRARRARRPRRASAASPRGRAGCRPSPGRPPRPRRARAGRRASRAVSAHSSRGSGASWIAAVPAQAGRISARSVRARQQTRIGASRLQPARYSIRSRNAGSAHWMSSSTTRTERRRASVSKQAAHRPVQLAAAGASLDPPRRLEDALAHGLAVRLAGEDLVEIQPADDLDERPVGDALAVRKAAPFEHEDVVADVGDQLAGEPRLADSGLADDRHDPTRRARLTAASSSARSASSSAARPTKGESIRRGDAGDVRLDLEQAPGRDRLRLPLQLQRRAPARR